MMTSIAKKNNRWGTYRLILVFATSQGMQPACGIIDPPDSPAWPPLYQGHGCGHNNPGDFA